jgi:hypothetical protein
MFSVLLLLYDIICCISTGVSRSTSSKAFLGRSTEQQEQPHRGLVTTPLPSAYTFLLTFIFLIASHSFCSHLLLDALNKLTRCSAFEATVATFENRSRSAQSNAARCAKYGRNKSFGCRRDNIRQARTFTPAESDTMASGTLFTPRNNPSSAVNSPSFRYLQHNALPITRD